MAKSNERRAKIVVNAKKWAAEQDGRGGFTSMRIPEGVNLWAPKDPGSYRINILPYKVGKGNKNCDEGLYWWERTYWAHKQVGIDKRSYCCPGKNWGKPCPICQHVNVLSRKPAETAQQEEEIRQEISALAAKERQLFNIWDMGDADKGVQLWEVSPHLFGKYLKAKIANCDEADHYETFVNPDEDGYLLKLGATQKKFNGMPFLEFSDIEFKRRPEPIPEEILDRAVCLDNVPKEISYEELKKIFHGVEGEAAAPGPANRHPTSGNGQSEGPQKGKYKRGDLVIHDDEECEVIQVSADGKKLTLQDEDGGIRSGVAEGDVRRVPTRDGPGKHAASKKPAHQEDDDEDEETGEEGDEGDDDDDEGEEEAKKVHADVAEEDEPPAPKRGRGRPAGRGK